jgi:SAM-dependent methyltransferase
VPDPAESGTYDTHAIVGVFDRAAPQYDSVIPFFASFGRRLVEHARLRPGESVLDVGCGRGASLFPAAERVGPSGRVLGVDLSEAMVTLLSGEIEQRDMTNVSVRRMDAEALDVEPGSFDVGISNFVLHLVAHPEKAAASLFRALRPGGRCAVSVPAGGSSSWDFLFPLLRTYGPRATRPMAIPFRSDFDLVATLASAGFETAPPEVEQMEFHFADENAWWSWAWSHGMRGLFELLPADDLEDLRRELFAELAARKTSDGIPMGQKGQYVTATKP